MASGLPACATCGATQGRLVAPNYVACGGTVDVAVQETRLVGERPINGDPRFGVVPIWDVVAVMKTEPCPSRHHVPMTGSATPLPRCVCGTFAIGLCAVCDAPVCGDDSARDDGLRVCRSCQRRRAEERAAQAGRLADERRRAAGERQFAAGRTLTERQARAACGHDWSQLAPDGRCWTCQPA